MIWLLHLQLSDEESSVSKAKVYETEPKLVLVFFFGVKQFSSPVFSDHWAGSFISWVKDVRAHDMTVAFTITWRGKLCLRYIIVCIDIKIDIFPLEASCMCTSAKW